MANLTDFYRAPGGSPLEFQLQGMQQDEAQSRIDAGLNKTRRDSLYFGRTVPDITNAASARGTVRGGSVGVQADRAREDYNWQTDSADQLLRRHMADLNQNRIMATLGTTFPGGGF